MNENENNNLPKPINLTQVLLIAVAITLFLDLLLNGYGFYKSVISDIGRAAKIQAAEALVTEQQTIINDLYEKYTDAVYNNLNVETIYQQQLITDSYILQALQLMAKQNTQIIELLIISAR